MIKTQNIDYLYTYSPSRAMNVVVFGSGSGTILEALLEAQKKQKHHFTVRALFADRMCRFQTLGNTYGIPVITYPFQRGQNRIKYDADIVQFLDELSFKEDFTIDIILLAGYMRIVHAPLLKQYPNKILNVHPADLTVLNNDGTRRYVGTNAVFDALNNGETCTRSSVILVDENIDTGPILVSGPDVYYDEGRPITDEKAKKHQEKQKRTSDWPAAIAAIEMIAAGRVGIGRDNVVYVDGKPMPPGGQEL